MALTDIDGQRLGDNVADKLGNRNLIINGAMQVAQRGTSSTGQTASGFLVDRFNNGISSAGTWTISQSTDVPDGFANSIKYDCTTANTSLGSTAQLYLVQKVEAQNLQHLDYGSSAAQAITFSFYFKTNKTGVYTAELFQADASRSIGFEVNVTQTGWQRYQFVIPGDTAGTINNDNGIGFWCFVWLAAGSSFTSGTFTNGAWATGTQANRLSSNQVNFADSTSNECFFTGVQLEVGNTATPFEHRSFGDELARCHRYFYMLADNGFKPIANFQFFTTTAAYGVVHFPVRMRDQPSIHEQDVANGIRLLADNTVTELNGNIIHADSSRTSTQAARLQITSGISESIGDAAWAELNNNGAKFGFDAEL